VKSLKFARAETLDSIKSGRPGTSVLGCSYDAFRSLATSRAPLWSTIGRRGEWWASSQRSAIVDTRVNELRAQLGGSRIIQGIRGGERAYKAETLSYLNCSRAASTARLYYPQTAGSPSSTRWNFIQTGHGEYLCWSQLNVTATRRCALAISSSPRARPGHAAAPGSSRASWPPATNPWYIVMATAGPTDGVTY